MLTKIISDAAHLRVFWVWYAKKYLSHLKDHLKVHSMPVKYEDSWRRPFYFPHRHTATAGVGNHLDRLHLQLHFWIFDQAASLTLFSTWFSTLYLVPFDSLLPVFTLFTFDWWLKSFRQLIFPNCSWKAPHICLEIYFASEITCVPALCMCLLSA